MYKIKINKLAAICLVLTHTMIHVYCALVNGIIKKSIWSNGIHKQGMFFKKSTVSDMTLIIVFLPRFSVN